MLTDEILFLINIIDKIECIFSGQWVQVLKWGVKFLKSTYG